MNIFSKAFSIAIANTLLIASLAQANQQVPTVKLDQGEIQGIEQNGVQAFLGIPYAHPPVGDLRWAAPVPVSKSDHTYKADGYRNDCMQIPFPSDAAPLGTEPAEDCLYMNVWTKAGNKSNPVLVWIHGGGFVNGGASPDVYNGSAFARDDLVFISFNYRLARFGYFAHPAIKGSPNFGIQDQLLAIKWIVNNAKMFGGDPNNITVMGESAGGFSVNYLLRNPDMRGLFRRAIVMSGSYLEHNPAHNTAAAAKIGANFAEKVGISSDGAEALAALRALPADKVAEGINLASLFQRSSDFGTTYAEGPIDDGETITSKPISDAELNPVDVMVGSNSKDIGSLSAQSKQEVYAKFGADADRAKQLYDPGGDAPLEQVVYNVGQDYMMQAPVGSMAKRYSQLGHNAYAYRFGYVAESLNPRDGAPHASEIPFFFNTEDAKYGEATTSLDRQATDNIHRYVVNFARTGNPNGQGLPEWKSYSDAPDQILRIENDAQPVFNRDPIGERLELVRKHLVKHGK